MKNANRNVQPRSAKYVILLSLLLLPACNTAPAPFAEASGSSFEFLVDPVSETVILLEAERNSLRPQYLPSDTHILEPGVDIDLRNFDFSFDPAKKRLVLRMRFENVTADKDFLQPFFFTLKGEQSDSFKRATAPLVTDRQLGGDGVLSPGERTHRLTFVVVHLDKPFSFFVDVSAAVTGETPQVWPNAQSSANSDTWLVEHHNEVRRIEPKLLVINFSNLHSPAQVEQKLQDLIAALAESSRWHGYDDSDAPAFLDYKVAKFVDLRDRASPPPPSCDGNSSHYPRKPGVGFNFDYKQLYGETFASHYGYPDPQLPSRFLTLGELIEGGVVNEVWFLATQKDACGYPFEAVELKQFYDEDFGKTGYGVAGNGHDYEIPWIGRSLRINYINLDRGVGCAMENLGHALERTSSGRAVPYLTRYFADYGDFNLDRRYGLPFDSFYSYRLADLNNLQKSDDQNTFPAPNTLKAQFRGDTFSVQNFVAHGGNVHFAPNARQHYDLWSPYEVMSTIKSWRMGNGLNGEDLAEPFTISAFQRYNTLAPDCMGPWLVYWRQNMPGLDNLAKDDAGQAMKNWWPFLFY